MLKNRIPGAVRTLALATFGIATISLTPLAVSAQHEHHEKSTPTATYSCEAIGTPTAMADHGSGGDENAETVEIEFDLLYIDMMLPHHGSIIALAEAALPHLTDPRLQEMAANIIEAQTAENAQLTEWRAAWFGSGEPVMSDTRMEIMLDAMPAGTMDEMMREMDAQYQVETFCAAENPDLAFIQQVIPHHQMAIDVSVIAVEEGEHPDLVALAEDVISAQQAEIDLLNQILAEYEAAGTPIA